MISGKKLFTVSLISLIVAAISFGLVYAGITQAKYLVYISVFIGAISGFIGGIGAALGKVEKDF